MTVRWLPAASLAVCSTLSAQQLSERVEVRVVNVDVTVSSRGGEPVRGLTRDDFEIFEDGKRQTLTNFYAVDESSPVAAGAAPQPAAVVPPAPAPPVQDEQFRRKVLVLVDNYHTTRHSRDIALRSLEEMINDRFHGDYDWSIGVVGRGVSLILPLTSDKKAIHEALELVRGAGTRRESAAAFGDAAVRQESTQNQFDPKPTTWQIFDRDYQSRLEQAGGADDAERAIGAKFTIQGIVDAARGFASTPGRKIIFFLTGDIGLNDIDFVRRGPMGDFQVRGITGRIGSSDLREPVRTMADLRRTVVEEANASDVSFFFWNVEGLVPFGELGVSSRPLTNNSASFWIANQTGGRLVAGNDPLKAVQEFDTSSSTYYSLGYSPAHPDDGRYHRIEVRLKKRGGLTLQYRTGYSGSPTAEQLERAMQSPTAAAMQPGGLPVTLVTGKSSEQRGGVSVPIEVKVPFPALQFLPTDGGVAAHIAIYVSVFDAMGKNLVSRRYPVTPAMKSSQPDPKGVLVYRNAVSMRKGERHRIVVAVRDETTDAVGMATEVVQF